MGNKKGKSQNKIKYDSSSVNFKKKKKFLKAKSLCGDLHIRGKTTLKQRKNFHKDQDGNALWTGEERMLGEFRRR